MKFATTKIATAVTSVTLAVLAWSAGTFHWTTAQIGASSGVAVSTVALGAFIVEHRRKGTPSRWVGVLGMIPAEVTTVVTVGIAFAWWGASAVRVSSLVLAIVVPLASLAGVTIAQAKVTSPETMSTELESVAITVAAAKNVDPATHAQ